jgi:hypothetical protein
MKEGRKGAREAFDSTVKALVAKPQQGGVNEVLSYDGPMSRPLIV